MSSAICLNLDQSKILSSGNGLRSVMIFKKKKMHKFKSCSFPIFQEPTLSNRTALLQNPFHELEVWLQEGCELAIRDSCGKS